jgi:hypothetical protein
MIKVYHITHDIDQDAYCAVAVGYHDEVKHLIAVNAAWNDGLYVLVAIVDTTDFDFAYRVTNNIDSSWSMQPDTRVTVKQPLSSRNGQTVGHRSTSIGDVLVQEGKRNVVSLFGFTEVPE